MNRWLMLAKEPDEKEKALPDTRPEPAETPFCTVLAGCRVEKINAELPAIGPDTTAPRRSAWRSDLPIDPFPQPDDAEAYANALRLHGPTSYGGIARILGWGATRAGQAEEAVRKAGRIAYDRAGMGRLIEKEDGQ